MKFQIMQKIFLLIIIFATYTSNLFSQTTDIDINQPIDTLKKILIVQFPTSSSSFQEIGFYANKTDSLHKIGEYYSAISYYNLLLQLPECSKLKTEISEKINLAQNLTEKTNEANKLLMENNLEKASEIYNNIIKSNPDDLYSKNKINAIKKIKSGDLIFVEGGTFLMGSKDEVGKKDEHPQHKVTLTNYFIGKTEVTNKMYADFLKAYGSDTVKNGEYVGKTMIYENEIGGLIKENKVWKPVPGKENYPVICLNWYGANEFCNFYGYKLPSEAQWEYAAKGGINWENDFYFSGNNNIKKIGWFYKNAKNKENKMLKKRGTHEVAQLEANQLGIYDMTGNVRELCLDWYGSYKSETTINPVNTTKGKRIVNRGGSWDTIESEDAKITVRECKEIIYLSYNLGFRVVVFP